MADPKPRNAYWMPLSAMRIERDKYHDIVRRLAECATVDELLGIESSHEYITRRDALNALIHEAREAASGP